MRLPCLKSVTTLLVIIFSTFTALVQAAPPLRMIVPPATPGWTNPVISPDGGAIAFTDEFYSELKVLISGEDSPRSIVTADGVGKRFVFEPGRTPRIVYRVRLNGLPERPERLLSSSIYNPDPVHRTPNKSGDLFGPYLINGQVWYASALDQPLLNYDGEEFPGGPRWDWINGKLWLLNEAGDTVFTTPDSCRLAGGELSPDGRWMAVVQSEPQRELFVIHRPDGSLRRLGDGYSPRWSGDSQTLVFVTSTGGGFAALNILNMASGEPQVILNAPEYYPESPALDQTASRVVFASNGALYEMLITTQ